MAAQQQNNVQIAAPGFMGLNTQDSPVGMPLSFASIADQCVIDDFGRIASRKGLQAYTDNPAILNDGPGIEVVQEFITEAGVEYLFCAGELTLWSHTLVDPESLVALTLPGGYAITDNNWQIIPFNDKCFFFQAGQQPLVFDPAVSTTALALLSEEPFPAAGYPDCGTAAFGHLWAANFDADQSILAYSALLDGESWATGGGSFDLTAYWPSGYDKVEALVAHNDFMIVFGQRSILLYSVPDSGPVDMQLVDTIEGIGCIARDTVAPTGKDVVFLDSVGVRSLARTVQEKSVPIGDISINVKKDIKDAIRLSDTDTVRAVYHPEDSFYAVFFPEINANFIFDTRHPLENGAWRATRWPNIAIRCGCRSLNRETWFGGRGGLYLYQGADDFNYDPDNAYAPRTQPIRMKYYTQPQTFEMPSNLKFPKQLDLTLFGSTALDLVVKWAFDYSNDYKSFTLTRPGSVGYQYNIDEYEAAEYSGDGAALSTERVNLWGNGRNITFGFEGTVLGTPLSMQELNIQALLGRII